MFDLTIYFFNLITPLFQNGIIFFNNNFYFQFCQNMTFFFSFKFCMCIALLILIRGGAPRYRYDYLTKLGWLKFLSFIILIFILTLFFLLIF